MSNSSRFKKSRLEPWINDQRWTNAGEEFREGLAIAAVPVGGP